MISSLSVYFDSSSFSRSSLQRKTPRMQSTHTDATLHLPLVVNWIVRVCPGTNKHKIGGLHNVSNRSVPRIK